MADFADPRLTAWQSFYVIVGSSGAALIGVQFVVITLIAGMRRRTTAESIGALPRPPSSTWWARSSSRRS